MSRLLAVPAARRRPSDCRRGARRGQLERARAGPGDRSVPDDDIAGNVAGSALHFAGDQVAGAAVAALLGVIKFFVGDLDRELGRQLVHFLLGVNDFTNPSYRALNTYAGYVQAIAWGARPGVHRRHVALLAGRVRRCRRARRAAGAGAVRWRGGSARRASARVASGHDRGQPPDLRADLRA